jgi:hypothetical protein
MEPSFVDQTPDFDVDTTESKLNCSKNALWRLTWVAPPLHQSCLEFVQCTRGKWLCIIQVLLEYSNDMKQRESFHSSVVKIKY